MTSTAVARFIGAIAVGVIVITGALASGFSPLAIPFILYALVPYGLLYLAARITPNAPAIAGAGAAALAVELGVRAGVMLFPRGSTAAIALVFSPVFIGAIAMPVGAGGGVALGWVFECGGLAVRTVSVLLAASVLALTFIAFARPELFPTTMAARRRHLAEIGEPRVVAAGDRFTRRLVHDRASWPVAGEFDGEPGEELAVVDHAGAQLIDLETMQPERSIAFGGEPGRLWSWYSRLVRIGDALAVVQTGGGFQQTELRSLNNDLLWNYRPDPKLAPTALLPGDLDGDGEIEFYASTTGAITRLSPRGETVWSTAASLPHLVALAPPASGVQGWVVSARYEVSVDVLSPAGVGVATVAWPGPVHGVIEWPDARYLLAGTASAKGIDLRGETRFEIPIDEPLRLMEAKVWNPRGGPAMLAVTMGGDRDLKRWRLRLYESPTSMVYDEVFDSPARLLTVTAADGVSTLFVVLDSKLYVLQRATEPPS